MYKQKFLTFKNFAILHFYIVIIIFCIIMKKVITVSFNVGINNSHHLPTLGCQIINHVGGLRKFNRIPGEVPTKRQQHILLITIRMNQELLTAYTTCTEPSLNPLKTKINLNCIQSLRSRFTVNTRHFNYKNRRKKNQLIQYRLIIAGCYDIMQTP